MGSFIATVRNHTSISYVEWRHRHCVAIDVATQKVLMQSPDYKWHRNPSNKTLAKWDGILSDSLDDRVGMDI